MSKSTKKCTYEVWWLQRRYGCLSLSMTLKGGTLLAHMFILLESAVTLSTPFNFEWEKNTVPQLQDVSQDFGTPTNDIYTSKKISQGGRKQYAYAIPPLEWGGMAYAYRLAKVWAMTIPSTKGERNAWSRFALIHVLFKLHELW